MRCRNRLSRMVGLAIQDQACAAKERGGSLDRFRRRIWSRSRQIGCPIVHETTPVLEQVRGPVGRKCRRLG